MTRTAPAHRVAGVVVDRSEAAGGTSGSGEGNLLVSDKGPGAELAMAQRAVPDLYEGELTAAVHVTEDEVGAEGLPELVSALSGVAGRVVFNAWPTGVAVTHAMQHGGPYPATTDAGRTTSVGSAAIARFLRPVTFQGATGALAALLPAVLRDDVAGDAPRSVSRAGQPAGDQAHSEGCARWLSGPLFIPRSTQCASRSPCARLRG